MMGIIPKLELHHQNLTKVKESGVMLNFKQKKLIQIKYKNSKIVKNYILFCFLKLLLYLVS
jgi:hypothetical protein